ncbi:MAG TPA: 1-acyl-sn-glycerol-3-phosphate acyltransferase [Pseudonocardiaceae bacterium]|nr:1-acyl-sn-glycerol-3-phosphate acyltransferase [Pseudonocardiaceae bacterium]
MTPDGTWLWLQGLTRWIGTWCFFVGYRLRVHRRDRIPTSGPVVVVANYSAIVDGPLLYGLLGRRSSFLIKQEMFAASACRARCGPKERDEQFCA